MTEIILEIIQVVTGNTCQPEVHKNQKISV